MDLLKIFPNVTKMLRQPERILWTLGYQTMGRLNHPAVWNSHGDSHGAFLWLEKPNLARDAHGWVNLGGYACTEPEIECTWLEWLRDAWAHSYGTVILPSLRDSKKTGLLYPPVAE